MLDGLLYHLFSKEFVELLAFRNSSPSDRLQKHAISLYILFLLRIVLLNMSKVNTLHYKWPLFPRCDWIIPHTEKAFLHIQSLSLKKRCQSGKLGYLSPAPEQSPTPVSRRGLFNHLFKLLHCILTAATEDDFSQKASIYFPSALLFLFTEVSFCQCWRSNV